MVYQVRGQRRHGATCDDACVHQVTPCKQDQSESATYHRCNQADKESKQVKRILYSEQR